MLSAIGRTSMRKAGTNAFFVYGRVSESSWQLQRVAIAQNRSNATYSHSSRAPQATRSSKRGFATVTTTPAKAHEKQPAGKKSTATKKVSTRTVKKKKVKKTLKKTPKKKVAAKRKSPAKKILTEDQKTRRDERVAAEKTKLKLRELKRAALFTEPKKLGWNAWLVIISEETERLRGNNTTGLGVIIPAATAKFRGLTVSEREQYNHIANQNKAANATAYDNWLAAHTPDQIRLANKARLFYRRINAKSARAIPLIKDSRLPVKPTLPRILYVKERWASGDFKGLRLVESLKTLHKDWENLPDQEKKRFESEYLVEKDRYNKEYKNVFNRDPPSRKASASASA